MRLRDYDFFDWAMAVIVSAPAIAAVFVVALFALRLMNIL